MHKRIVLCAVMALTIIGFLSLTACASQKIVTEQEKFTVTRGNITQSVNADGSVSLPLDRKLTFGTSGKIERVNVEEGDKVTRGQVIARLEMALLERAVKTADLAIASAEADFNQAELGIRTSELDLEQATDAYRKITYPYIYSTFAFDVPAALSSISSAERQVAEARKTLQTGQSADQFNQISRQLKNAADSLAVARERLARGTGQDVFAGQVLPVKDFWTLRAAQLNVERAKETVDNARISASKARLAVDKARHEMETARDMVDKAIVTAPFDGVIAKLDVKPGDSFTTVDFTKTAVHIIDPRRMELTIDVDEIDIPNVKVGQEATISIDALPGNKLTGKVAFISPLPKVEAGVVLYQVKIAFAVPENLGLRTGMSASADVATARRNNVLMLPTRTLTQDSVGKHTVKLLVNGQVEEKAVVTGISDSLNTEIVSGLSEDDTVVIERQVKTGSAGFFG